MIQFLIKPADDGTTALVTLILRDGEVASEYADRYTTYEEAREKIPSGYVVRAREGGQELWTIPCLRSVR